MTIAPFRHLNQCATRWALLPVWLVVWLAPFLGGSVEHWSRAILFLLLGLLLLIYPPNHGLTRRARVLLGIFALLPLTAFLPVALTGLPAWRGSLAGQQGVVFPGTLSAQPWLALDAWLLWLGALIWVWWLAGQGWTRTTRKPLAELFAVGMQLLALVAILSFHTHHPLPFWHNERGFGPFPNRNQTANLLALAFVLHLGLLHMAFLRKSKLVALWGSGLLVLGYALILNYSRAGILLPVLGAGIYWLIQTMAAPSRKKLWVGISLALIGVSLLLGFGGATLERFNPETIATSGVTTDFRLLIFRDALSMNSQGWLFGVGLAGFEWVFPLFRELSVVDRRIIHPESDWLWLASEVGWPAALLMLGSCLWLLAHTLRGAMKKPHPLRVAGVVCGVLFVLHGFFDVSAHRPGTFFPALFLFTLAWPGEAAPTRPAPRWLTRAACILLFLPGIGWFLNGTGKPFWPGPQSLAADKKSISASIAGLSPASALPLIEKDLALAPLDWELYYQRGASRILQKRDWPLVLADFRLALLLEPTSPNLPDIEGTAWLSYRPELAALPWTETLRRLSPETRPGKYERLLVLSTRWPRLRSQMEAIAGKDISLSLVRLGAVEEARFPQMLAEFLQEHPSLGKLQPREQRAFLDLWADRGDPEKFIAWVRANPGVERLAVFPQARALARSQKYAEASRLLLRRLPAPVIPYMKEAGDQTVLMKQLRLSKNLLSGLTLYQSQVRQKDTAGALMTLLQLEKLPDAPPYVHYLIGSARAKSERWDEAWVALEIYARKTGF